MVIRLYAFSRQPLHTRIAEYPHSYSCSLSLLAGRGNRRLPLPDAPSSLAIRNFLDMKTNEIDVDEWSAYIDAMPTEGSPGFYPYVDHGRLGELLTAATVWKICGIKWSSLFYFHIGISTAACLALMIVSWRTGGHYSAGLIAGAVFALSRVEATLPLRDKNAIWFTAFAFLAFDLLYRRYRGRYVLLSALALGFSANLGYLWRPTTLIVTGFIFLASSLKCYFDTRSLKRTIAAGACFLAGAFAVIQVAKISIDDAKQMPMGSFFHIAYFGDSNRAKLLGIEDSYQIAHDDSKTAADACDFRDTRRPEVSPFEVYGAGYGFICREMYLSLVRSNLFNWVYGVPRILMHATGADSFRTLPMALLFLAGLTTLFRSGVDRFIVCTLAVFLCYYAAIWFALSPELRHWGMFLVPLSIVGGLAPKAVVDAVRADCSALDGRRRFIPDSKMVLMGSCSVAAWLLMCLIAYFVSASARADQLEEVLKLSSSDGERLAFQSNHDFYVHHIEGDENFRIGYLLEIEAGDQSSELFCKHLRLSKSPPALFSWNESESDGTLSWARRTIWWNSFLETSHSPQPNQKQLFFVSCMRTVANGDRRSYSLKVEINGDARIVGIRQIDLKNWTRLQMSTLFNETETFGTTPRVGETAPSRTLAQFEATPDELKQLGFSELAR